MDMLHGGTVPLSAIVHATQSEQLHLLQNTYISKHR